ncbi:MAG: hypothetical protein A3K19_26450 [Lentisphaerae bacterium RIFOXYB12_FULL_65_16]|nr:MAG: hypothetical protein A3K18_08620 [Lentisphaerae bacterium RIFOXYA12_64_32]OGV87815.1 MAG: hypothetical protein A3K19_26450 [Lentisphaerae bacterium RIFOXYB12_FULL_65_16]
MWFFRTWSRMCLRTERSATLTSAVDWHWDTRPGLTDFDLLAILDGDRRSMGVPPTAYRQGRMQEPTVRDRRTRHRASNAS